MEGHYRDLAGHLVMFKPKPFANKCSKPFKDLLGHFEHERGEYHRSRADIKHILDNNMYDQASPSDELILHEDDDARLLEDVHLANDPESSYSDSPELMSNGFEVSPASTDRQHPHDMHRSTTHKRKRPKTRNTPSSKANVHVEFDMAASQLPILKEQPVPSTMEDSTRQQLYDRYIDPDREWFQGMKSVLFYTDTLEDVRRRLRIRNKLVSTYLNNQGSEPVGFRTQGKLLEKRAQTSVGLNRRGNWQSQSMRSTTSQVRFSRNQTSPEWRPHTSMVRRTLGRGPGVQEVSSNTDPVHAPSNVEQKYKLRSASAAASARQRME